VTTGQVKADTTGLKVQMEHHTLHKNSMKDIIISVKIGDKPG
jgi:hypothetical protein